MRLQAENAIRTTLPVMITQTGGGCRATNYIAFLRKALKEAGYPNVPVISLNVSGLEGNPGFKITPKLVDGLLKACTWGDLLLAVTLRIRPYEVNEGETNAVHEKWQSVCTAILLIITVNSLNLKRLLMK